MIVKKNQDILYNVATWVLMLVVLGCKITGLSATVENNDINGFILQSIFALFTIGNIVLRANAVLYKDKLVELTNQLLHCNWAWGK